MHIRNNLKITDFNQFKQLIGGVQWKLSAVIEYIESPIMSHYLTWIKTENNTWIKLDDAHVETNLNIKSDLQGYTMLLFKKIY